MIYRRDSKRGKHLNALVNDSDRNVIRAVFTRRTDFWRLDKNVLPLVFVNPFPVPRGLRNNNNRNNNWSERIALRHRYYIRTHRVSQDVSVSADIPEHKLSNFYLCSFVAPHDAYDIIIIIMYKI